MIYVLFNINFDHCASSLFIGRVVTLGRMLGGSTCWLHQAGLNLKFFAFVFLLRFLLSWFIDFNFNRRTRRLPSRTTERHLSLHLVEDIILLGIWFRYHCLLPCPRDETPANRAAKMQDSANMST